MSSSPPSSASSRCWRRRPAPVGRGSARGDNALKCDTVVQLLEGLLADPVLCARIVADATLHRVVLELLQGLPPAEKERLERMLHAPAANDARPAAATNPIRGR